MTYIFDYNSDFIPNYNIFNIDNNSIKGNIGINNIYPKKFIEIDGNVNVSNDLLVNNNIYYNNNTLKNVDSNKSYILYQYNSNNIRIGSLNLYNTDNDNKWIKEENEIKLKLDILNDNNIIEYRSQIINIKSLNSDSPSYSFIENIKLYNNDNIIINYIISNKELTNLRINNIITNQVLDDSNNFIYKLNEELFLNLENKNIDIICSCDESTNVELELLGRYEYTQGSFFIKENNNIFSYKNVSIFSNNNYNNSLYINGICNINSNVSSNNIESNILNITNNINSFSILLNNIQTNNLFIETEKLNIGKEKNNYNINIGDVNINKDGNVFIENLHILNNLNIFKIQHNSSLSYLELNEKTFRLYYKLFRDDEGEQECIDEACHKENIISINKDKLNINTKLIIKKNEKSNDLLQNYNLVVNDNVKLKNIVLYSNLNFNNIVNNINKVNIKDFTYKNSISENLNVENIECKILETNNILFKNSNIQYNNTGSIYFDNNNNIRCHGNNNFYFMTDYLSTFNKYTILSGDSIKINNVITNNLNIKTIKLPLYNSVYENYNFDSNLIGNLKVENNNILLNDGVNWNILNVEKIEKEYIYLEKKYNKFKIDNSYKYINSDLRFKIIFNHDKTSVLLEKTDLEDNKTFKIIMNKVYTLDNKLIPFTLFNIEKIIDTDNYTANIIYDLKIETNNFYFHMTKLNIIEEKLYEIEELLPNLYKLKEINSYSSEKIYLKNFMIYNENHISSNKYLIDGKYNNTYNCITFSKLDKEVYYNITLLDSSKNLIRLDIATIQTINSYSFYIDDFKLAISLDNTLSLHLVNIKFIDNYYTAYLINDNDYNEKLYSNNYLSDENYINKYHIKEKNLIDINKNIYEVYLNNYKNLNKDSIY